MTDPRADEPAPTSLAFAGDYLPFAEYSRGITKPAGTAFVANLECAISGANKAPTSKAYSVVVEPEALSALRYSGIRAVNLANNHVLDSGDAAFRNLIALLRDDDSVDYFGLSEKPFCEIKIGSAKCAVIGSLEPCRARGRTLFRQENVRELIRELRPRFDRVFVTPHWGKEGEFAHHPSPDQQRLARHWVDAGADGVFGHHPHTVQGVEWHESRPIFYSLGNLLFRTEENAQYPLTSAGICVHWFPASGLTPDRYEPRFVATTEHVGAALSAARNVQIGTFFVALSEDLAQHSRLPALYLNWARRVGPVYVHKSMQSWRRRMRSDALHTFPRWIAWLLHPKTHLLALGYAFPDERLRQQISMLQNEFTDPSALQHA